MQENDRDLLRYIIAIFVPPLAVWLQVGFTAHFWINLALLLFPFCPYIGALIHAFIVIAKYEDKDAVKEVIEDQSE